MNLSTFNFILLFSNYLFMSNLMIDIKENVLIIKEAKILMLILEQKASTSINISNELFFITESLVEDININASLNTEDFTSSPIFLIFFTTIILGKNLFFSLSDLIFLKHNINNYSFATTFIDLPYGIFRIGFRIHFDGNFNIIMINFFNQNSLNFVPYEDRYRYLFLNCHKYVPRIIKSMCMLSKMNEYHYDFIVQNNIPFTLSEMELSHENYKKFIAYLSLDWPADLCFNMNPAKGEFFFNSYWHDTIIYDESSFFRLLSNISYFLFMNVYR